MLRAAESPNHGLGVFATQSVSAGTLLWREKPLLMLDMKEMAMETERMMAARDKGEDSLATATRVPLPSINPPNHKPTFLLRLSSFAKWSTASWLSPRRRSSPTFN